MTCVKNGLRCNGIVAWLGNTDQICRGEKKVEELFLRGWCGTGAEERGRLRVLIIIHGRI